MQPRFTSMAPSMAHPPLLTQNPTLYQLVVNNGEKLQRQRFEFSSFTLSDLAFPTSTVKMPRTCGYKQARCFGP